MNELQNIDMVTDIALQNALTIENRMEIIEDAVRKKYLTRLTDMPVAPIINLPPLEEDIIDNIRLYRITEMVYQKGESAVDKFTTVFNTLSTYNATAFIVIDSDGTKTDFYIGVRNNEMNDQVKRSTVTLGDTLKNTLIGHFPGIKIQNENRLKIAELSDKIISQNNIATVSILGDKKSDKDQPNEQFVQGLEKLALAMEGRQYVGIIVAENNTPDKIYALRKLYQHFYTAFSPYQKVQFSHNTSDSISRGKTFSEMTGPQKKAMLANAAISLGFGGVGALMGGPVGAMVGSQIAGQLNGFISMIAPTEQKTITEGISTSTTTENKEITDLLQLLDDSIKRTFEFDSYGMWNIAAYFISDDMSAAEIAASNYRSLMNGEKSGKEVSAINSWRKNNLHLSDDFDFLCKYLSRFLHPNFYYGADIVKATTNISGKELGIHLGLPRTSVSGLPVIEHAEFGKEVNTYSLISSKKDINPEDRITLGRVFDLGQITNKVVELDNKSLNMHTFITGSTGSGKSNTVYQILSELHQDKVPFLVVEPAKGEYKDVFGHWDDVNVYSTNPNIAPLINLNPFKFPDSIHVLEHVDGLVEIFSVCWPMYDAMPAFFKDAILRSYEAVGWDLGSSTFDGKDIEYPDFEVLVEQLNYLIEKSDYASDIKSNYRGALVTRVKSLTVGLNKFIFTTEQTPYEKLFDENCILDISRVKSGETKALLMGLMVYILNEYRVDQKKSSNSGLKHVTVLEEAHNLLKNTSSKDSELIGKSVEMLTQTIAEIRTYGEGFIIVDQSPSAVDIAAIKNTNTKIVLRTPEAHDREAVGRSMGLTDDQVNEIAKLPSGVAVVYQNNWVNPVLTLVDKADVEELPYIMDQKMEIMTAKSARTNLIKMIMQPWLGEYRINEETLKDSLRVIELSREHRKNLADLISDYSLFNGQLVWKETDLKYLQELVKAVLNLENIDPAQIYSAEDIENMVSMKLKKLSRNSLREICYILTLKIGGDNNDA